MNEYQALGLLKAGRSSRSVVIPLGVEDGFIKSAQSKGPPGNHVVWAGSRLRRKDLNTMERAAALANCEFVRLGPGFSPLGASRSFGQVVDLFRGAEVLVVTSRYEGFSLPIAEARAAGIPVLCSDIPIHREVADETATLFFAPGDVNELAGLLRSRAWRELPRRRSWERTWTDVAHDVLGLVA